MTRSRGEGRRATVVLALIVMVAAVMTAVAGARDAAATATEPASAVGTRVASHDSAEVARTVERFHQAIARGDSALALSLLAADAVILESGDRESLAEYRAHHLPADIAFSQAVKEVRTPLQVTVRGDAAWAIGTGTSQGTFRGRPVNSASAELMVLTRTTRGWRIAVIHWSSHKRST